MRVPAGMQTWATSRRAATVATSACEPSPPAIPITCAPRVDGALGELEQVVAGLQDDRLDTSPPSLAARSKRSALPPPDFRLMISTAEPAAPTGTSAGRPVNRRLPRPPQRIAGGQAEHGEQQEQPNQHQHALPVSRQHHDQASAGERRERRAGNSPGTATGQGEPDGGTHNDHEPHREHSDREVTRQRDRGHDRHHNRRQERHDRSDARPQ